MNPILTYTTSGGSGFNYQCQSIWLNNSWIPSALWSGKHGGCQLWCYCFEHYLHHSEVLRYKAQCFNSKNLSLNMMTSSNGNIFRVTGHLCGEFTGPRWIPHTKASDAELWCLRINGWVNNREAGDLRRYRPHYDVIVMISLGSLLNRHMDCDPLSLKHSKVCINWTFHFCINYYMFKIMCTIYEV